MEATMPQSIFRLWWGVLRSILKAFTSLSKGGGVDEGRYKGDAEQDFESIFGRGFVHAHIDNIGDGGKSLLIQSAHTDSQTISKCVFEYLLVAKHNNVHDTTRIQTESKHNYSSVFDDEPAYYSWVSDNDIHRRNYKTGHHRFLPKRLFYSGIPHLTISERGWAA